MLSTAIKKVFEAIGLDVRRRHNNAAYTLCGLKQIPFGSVIDVGANTGQFARQMRKVFPRAVIHSIEPLPTAFAALQAWSAREPRGKVAVYNMAVGESIGVVEFNQHRRHSPSSSVLSTTSTAIELYPYISEQKKIRVQMVTLDSMFCAAGAIPEVPILLKLDVQGYEDRTLRGAERLLQRIDACICEVNVDGLYEGQASFAEIVTLLQAAGLSYAGNIDQACGRDGHAIYVDALFRRHSSDIQAEAGSAR